MIISLTGYRGTGKTTVGAILAAQLGYEYVDADDEVQRRAGRTIAEIFAEKGERAFRRLESDVVLDLVRRDRVVLALGGGALLQVENREAIKRAGPVVWLRASAETIHQRLAADPRNPSQRPNLTPEGGLSEIRHVLEERTPIYADCASLILDTENMTPQAVAERIVRTLDLDV
jgi:shikimate kinase